MTRNRPTASAGTKVRGPRFAAVVAVLLGGATYLLRRRASGPVWHELPDPSTTDASEQDAGAQQDESAQQESAQHEPAQHEPAQEQPPQSAAHDEEPTLRVHVERLSIDAELGTGSVDGVWWPGTDRAADAVPTLVAAVPEELGRVLRVSLPMADWSDDQPRSVAVDGRPVAIGWFENMPRRSARLTLEAEESVTVLVLPPDTDDEHAAAVLSEPAGERSRAELLQAAGLEESG